MRQSKATVVLCTPSYALHLAEVAKREALPLSELSVRRIIVAGESAEVFFPFEVASSLRGKRKLSTIAVQRK